jgi:methylated-DNA-[protein]-cysteine S-methyltransferase
MSNTETVYRFDYAGFPVGVWLQRGRITSTEVGEGVPIDAAPVTAHPWLGTWVKQWRAGRLPFEMLSNKMQLPTSSFYAAIYQALYAVPVGQTISYGELGDRIGQPAAARAVGSAMRKNPFPILIPCHRVVKSTGALGNYSGGGPAVKRALIKFERELA